MAERAFSFTREVSMGSFLLPPGGSYIVGTRSMGDREIGDGVWRAEQRSNGISIYVLGSDARDSIQVDHDGAVVQLTLSDQKSVSAWLSELPSPVFVDITSLAMATWAPLLRAAVTARTTLRFLYVEPQEYIRSAPQQAFSLSDYTEGIGAIPSFASLDSTTNESPPLVPMLGFEGARLARVMNRLEPASDKMFPVIGVPGFQVEYPFHSYEGNRRQLEDVPHNRIMYARANCPFDAFATLNELHRWLGGGRMQVAPLGTKPHALGATLFALARDPQIELIYDHPKPSARPTRGASRICVYYISEFVESDLFDSATTPAAA